MRASGLYWVRVSEDKWEVAEWNGVCWIILGMNDAHEDSDLVEIGEQVLARRTLEDMEGEAGEETPMP